MEGALAEGVRGVGLLLPSRLFAEVGLADCFWSEGMLRIRGDYIWAAAAALPLLGSLADCGFLS